LRFNKKFPYFADTTERLKEKGMIDKGGGERRPKREGEEKMTLWLTLITCYSMGRHCIAF